VAQTVAGARGAVCPREWEGLSKALWAGAQRLSVTKGLVWVREENGRQLGRWSKRAWYIGNIYARSEHWHGLR
jgi:hypothetical protein